MAGDSSFLGRGYHAYMMELVRFNELGMTNAQKLTISAKITEHSVKARQQIEASPEDEVVKACEAICPFNQLAASVAAIIHAGAPEHPLQPRLSRAATR